MGAEVGLTGRAARWAGLPYVAAAAASGAAMMPQRCGWTQVATARRRVRDAATQVVARALGVFRQLETRVRP